MANTTRTAEFVPGFPIGADDVVVDVGCGEGDACVFAGGLGAEVIATDFDPVVIDRIERRMQGVGARSFRALLSNSDPLPLPDSCADVVICTEVAEHVDDPRRFLAELARVGRPGARYLITVPDPASEEVMRRVAPDWYWQAPYHRHVYGPGQLDALLQEVGLSIVAGGSQGFYWSMWWLFRMAMDPRPLDPEPEAGPFRHWEAAWAALAETPRGADLAKALDGVLPKSQVRIARKPVAPTWQAAPNRRLRRWKGHLRDGSARLGPFDLRWQLRRSPRPTGG